MVSVLVRIFWVEWIVVLRVLKQWLEVRSNNEPHPCPILFFIPLVFDIQRSFDSFLRQIINRAKIVSKVVWKLIYIWTRVSVLFCGYVIFKDTEVAWWQDWIDCFQDIIRGTTSFCVVFILILSHNTHWSVVKECDIRLAKWNIARNLTNRSFIHVEDKNHTILWVFSELFDLLLNSSLRFFFCFFLSLNSISFFIFFKNYFFLLIIIVFCWFIAELLDDDMILTLVFLNSIERILVISTCIDLCLCNHESLHQIHDWRQWSCSRNSILCH